MASAHPGWIELSKWLKEHGMKACLVEGRATPGAGYGLFAAQDVETSKTLLRIPSKAMMSIKTLSSIYPPLPGTTKSLTAIQMISLHLALHRPQGGHASSCTSFGPYISVLPSEFDGHPLTWIVRTNGYGERLLQCSPMHTQTLVRKVHDRFQQDLEAVKSYTEVSHGRPVEVESFLWGWLNVNTRCFYHRLRRVKSDPDNVTLVPIVDFANHRPFSDHTHMKPVPTQVDTFDVAPIGMGEPFGITSPSKKNASAGEELFFEYGRHSNPTLFAEYGFINPFQRADIEDGSFEGQVNVQEHVEAILAQKGEVGQWISAVLKEEQYWGDWTLHSSPAPAYPSYRLMSALQLYSIATESNRSASYLEEHKEEYLLPWSNVLLGRAQHVSEVNDKLWRECLLRICHMIQHSARTKLQELDAMDTGHDHWCAYAMDCVQKLWVEEEAIAGAVEHSIEAGVEF